MIRLASFILILALNVPAAAQVTGSLAPVAPALKRDIVVNGDLVRIGDLVEHAGASADIAVFRAPDLGDTGSVPVQRVIEALRPHRVVALDTRGLSDVTVTRASRAIPVQEIESHILGGIAGHYSFVDARNITLVFDREPRALHVEPGVKAELRIVRLSFEARNGRFDITLDVPGSDALRRVPLRLTGRAVETFEVVTLARPIARGEILRANDVTVSRKPKTEVAADALADTKAAIGRSARGALRAGQILRQNDVMKAEIIQRNDTVVIYYEAPGVALTARGKALEAGAEGDTVNVLNLQSNRNVQATVSGPGRVVVTAIAPRIPTRLSAAQPAGKNTAE